MEIILAHITFMADHFTHQTGMELAIAFLDLLQRIAQANAAKQHIILFAIMGTGTCPVDALGPDAGGLTQQKLTSVMLCQCQHASHQVPVYDVLIHHGGSGDGSAFNPY